MEGKSKVLAYRIDVELETQLEIAFNNRDLKTVLELMNKVEANYKSINIIKKFTKVLDRREKINWGKQIIEMKRPINRVMGAYLLDQTSYYEIDLNYIHKVIVDFAHDEDWNVRQAGIDLFERIVARTETHEIGLLREYINSDDPYLRRLVLLTCKSIAKSASYDVELKAALLDILEVALAEDDPYVQTVSAETFKDGYMKYCTDMTLNWLEDKINNTDDRLVKSTILTILGTRYIEDNIESVLSIIDDMLDEDCDQIKKARSSALHVLTKKHHDRVSSFLESRLENRQALDHWAELEADGSLKTF